MRKLTAISVVLFSTVSATAAFADDSAQATAASESAAASEEAAPAAESASEEAAPAATETSNDSAAAAADGASPQAEQGPISVAALAGIALEDGYGIGLGVRGGYTIDHGLYVGGSFLYHLGEDVGPYDYSLMLIGAEGGYNLDAGPVIVRPYAGIGLATVSVSGSFFGVEIDESESKLYIAPGVTALYPIGSLFVGADARYTIVSDFDALGLYLTAGASF